MKYRALVLALLSTLVVFGCSVDNESSSDLNFDAPYSVALDGTINDGFIFSTSDDEEVILYEIKAQLRYTVGQLNAYFSVGDLNRTTVSIKNIKPAGNGFNRVSYSATLFVSWSTNYQVPSQFGLILPHRGDYQGQKEFFKAYGSDEHSAKSCMANGAHDLSSGIFWYYYRPQKNSCNLWRYQMNYTAYFPVYFRVSSENTQGKYPEYHKVWEDNRLVVTAIYSKENSGSQSPSDGGIAAYRRIYTMFLQRFGRPTSTTLPSGQNPGIDNPDVNATFRSQRGEVDLQIFLVDHLPSAGREFREKYNERTKISDFISYNGHSGLGANIAALADMGEFVAGQYQIFLINGCDTFAYVDNSLRDAHWNVNPNEGPYKYFDLITNAMPAYFHQNSASNMVIINALINANATYKYFLRSIDPNQRVNVTGEQDNQYRAL